MWGIYKITFTNQKSYIGQTCNLKRRLREYKNWEKCCVSQTALYAAFQKYGYDNATFSIIYESSETLDQEFLDNLEIKYIEEYKTLTPNGYNIEKGGHGHSGFHVLRQSYANDPYVQEPVLNLETGEEYETVIDWICKTGLPQDSMYKLYESDFKFCFKNQNKLQWNLGDGTFPENATIEDVRTGKAISYIKLPAFNRSNKEENCYTLNMIENHIKECRQIIKRQRDSLNKIEQEINQLEELAQKLRK